MWKGKRSYRWSWLACVVLILGCGSADQKTAPPSAPAIDIRFVKNGDLSPGLAVRYQPFDALRLDELRQQESLEAVVSGARDEFERILLVKDWVAEQWPHGAPDPYPPWDAIVVLEWIRSGRTSGWCGQYSQVLLQSFAALGLTARYVEIGTTANPYAHFVTEVWSNQFDKWVMMDADYNMHFERNSVPLSALEIHDALVRSELSEVRAVPGSFRDGHPDPQSWPLMTAELYYYVRLHLKADHLSVPEEPPFDRYNDMMDWTDELTVPWEVSQVESPYPKVRLTNLQSGNRASFASPMNQVSVTLESADAGELLLTFQNNVFQFQRYQLRELDLHGTPGDWRDHDAALFRWKPSRTSQTLEVRGVNLRGIPGPPSTVRARIGPRGR